MLQLTRGHFFGSHHQVVHLPGIIITDTQYTQDKVGWLLLKGKRVAPTGQRRWDVQRTCYKAIAPNGAVFKQY